MSGKPLPIKEIRELAADIREIKDFAENHGFDPSLVQATVTPSMNQTYMAWDWPLLSLGICVLLLLILLGGIAFYELDSPKLVNFLFVVGMILVVAATVAGHKRFDSHGITIIICVGLTAVLLVGTGVLTPKEAADRLQSMSNSSQ